MIARSRPNVPRTGRDSQETEPRRFCSGDPGDPGTPADGALGPLDSAFDARNPVKQAWDLASLARSRRSIASSQMRNATRGGIGSNRSDAEARPITRVSPLRSPNQATVSPAAHRAGTRLTAHQTMMIHTVMAAVGPSSAPRTNQA